MSQESAERTLRALFRNPDSSSRGTPFWAWNSEAEPEKMTGQIACFKEMGMGGFIVHSRTGLKTPYLGKEFMETVRACVKEAGRQIGEPLDRPFCLKDRKGRVYLWLSAVKEWHP